MNVLMTGVGGQGIILASDILSEVVMRAGFDVKKSEIHGMAQRGGSVMSHVRFAGEVASPLIPYGCCDILVSFEELEAARYLPYMNGGTTVIVNRFRLAPPSVIAGKEPYPDVVPILKGCSGNVYLADGTAVAQALGERRALNLVLMGVLSRFIEIPETLWAEVIADMVPERIREVNLEAFKRGRTIDLVRT